MTAPRDIVERLRERGSGFYCRSTGVQNGSAWMTNVWVPCVPDCAEAADTITSLRQRAEAAETRVAELEAAWPQVASVAREIELVAYTSVGDPKRMDDMKMYAIWAGQLQRAIAAAALAKGGAGVPRRGTKGQP